MSNGQSKQEAKNTKAQAITSAMKKEWPGITDVFKPHEIAWLTNFSKHTGYFSANPYPHVHGRLRLAHEDHKEGGLSIVPELELMGDKACIVTVKVVTRKGEYVARKAGKLDGDTTIEKIETGAVGRALTFAGYGAGAPSAEEMVQWIGENGRDKPEPSENGKQQKGEDADDETLQALKTGYLDFLKKNEVFENEGVKKTWQRSWIGKATTTNWTKEDTAKAMKLISWSVEVAGDQANAFFSGLTKAKKHEGLIAAFLEKMGVERITDIEDIKGWASALEQAAESMEVTFEVDEADIPI